MNIKANLVRASLGFLLLFFAALSTPAQFNSFPITRGIPGAFIIQKNVYLVTGTNTFSFNISTPFPGGAMVIRVKAAAGQAGGLAFAGSSIIVQAIDLGSPVNDLSNTGSDGVFCQASLKSPFFGSNPIASQSGSSLGSCGGVAGDGTSPLYIYMPFVPTNMVTITFSLTGATASAVNITGYIWQTGSLTQNVTGFVPAGSPVAGENPVLIAGSDNTNVRTILTDATGRITVNNSGSPFGSASQEAVSAANTAVSIASATGLNKIYMINARCSAGTATITITSNGVTVWTSAPGEVGTTSYFRTFPVPLQVSLTGTSLNTTLSTCGAANTGTLDVMMSNQ